MSAIYWFNTPTWCSLVSGTFLITGKSRVRADKCWWIIGTWSMVGRFMEFPWVELAVERLDAALPANFVASKWSRVSMSTTPCRRTSLLWPFRTKVIQQFFKVSCRPTWGMLLRLLKQLLFFIFETYVSFFLFFYGAAFFCFFIALLLLFLFFVVCDFARNRKLARPFVLLHAPEFCRGLQNKQKSTSFTCSRQKVALSAWESNLDPEKCDYTGEFKFINRNTLKIWLNSNLAESLQFTTFENIQQVANNSNYLNWAVTSLLVELWPYLLNWVYSVVWRSTEKIFWFTQYTGDLLSRLVIYSVVKKKNSFYPLRSLWKSWEVHPTGSQSKNMNAWRGRSKNEQMSLKLSRSLYNLADPFKIV